MIWTLFVHEMRLVAREPRFWIPFLIPPVFLVIMQVVLLSQYGNAAQSLEPTMLLMVGGLISTMVVALTADSFAGEKERNTLELLLSLPISTRSLFLGKLFAVVPVPLLLMTASQVLLWKLMGSPGVDVLVKAIVFGASTCLVVTGISLMVSLYSNTVRSAAQGNVLFVLGLLLATQWLAPRYFHVSWMPWVVGFGALLLCAVLLHFGLRRFEKMSFNGK